MVTSPLVFAAKGIITTCTSVSSTTSVCTTVDTENKNEIKQWKCTTADGGKTWSCSKAAVGKEPISPELGGALDAAIGEPQSTKKIPNDSFLDDGGVQGDNEDNDGLNDDDGGPSINPGLQ